jgi:hypothetical protein
VVTQITSFEASAVLPAEDAVPGTTDMARIDFRYSPSHWQTTFCFPDDEYKSLVGDRGELMYEFSQNKFADPREFGTVVEFTLEGMQPDRIKGQKLQTTGIPIVQTTIERPTATIALVTFATNRPGEGRVDNVLLTVRPVRDQVNVAPVIRLRSAQAFTLSVTKDSVSVVSRDDGSPFLVAAPTPNSRGGTILGKEQGGSYLSLRAGTAGSETPLRNFIRFPQEHQRLEQIEPGATQPESLLREAAAYWENWQPCENNVTWFLPEPHHASLVSCARNIQQAREIKGGRRVFQVGPTVYRGLWIVDGNFILEAARYLGYDQEAEDGLRAEWAQQLPTGQVVASAGSEHWKDTGIAMFTLVRQCELAQDWRLFHELEPNISRAVDFLIRLRDTAKAGPSTNGRYGLLAPGFPDGGIGGLHSEFTNTLWCLAGLRAVVEAGTRLGLASVRRMRDFYQELRGAFFAAAKEQMTGHPAGFEYLPMLMKDDPLYNHADPWLRPRPQSAQWALSHAIYPGLVFERDDPIVHGHIALMQACTQEDIPAETGWLMHEAVWTYAASFVAHVYLWAGLPDWAHRTFIGFLNHASPMYCWREEQPLQNALLGRPWGDMPHNWASAECVRYLRHMFALEDGETLRLLQGITDLELRAEKACELQRTPTRFGRMSMHLEPLGTTRGWRLQFTRDPGPMPQKVELPLTLGPRLRFSRVEGAVAKAEVTRVQIDPAVRTWSAYWS